MHKSTIRKAEKALKIIEKIEDQTKATFAVPGVHLPDNGNEQNEHPKVEAVGDETAAQSVAEGDSMPKHCNCSSSGCLKLYCECFKNNRFCGSLCRCQCCKNTGAECHQVARRVAQQQILMRNPLAFQSKIMKPKSIVVEQEVDCQSQTTKAQLARQFMIK